MIIENIFIGIYVWGFMVADLTTGCYNRGTRIDERSAYVEANCEPNYYLLDGEVSSDSTNLIKVSYES